MLTEGQPRASVSTAPASSSSARWWLIAPILLVFVIINQIDKSNISVLIADAKFAADFGATGQPARLGFISSAFFYGYGISLMAWGFVVDRIGARRSALIGVIGWALTTVWCAWAGSLTEMYAARFALGLAEGGLWPICNKYVGRWFARGEHGRIQAFWFNGAQIGIAIGLPVVTSILLAGGWRLVFLACGAVSAGILLPMFLWLAPDEPADSRWANAAERAYIVENRPAPWPGVSEGLKFLAAPVFWMIAFCHACLVATFFGLTTWIPSYLIKVRGLPFSTMSWWVASAYLIPVLLAIWIGAVSDRGSMPRATVGAWASLAMAILIVAGVNAPITLLSMLLLVTSMAAPITHGAANTALLHELVSPDQIGAATGLCVGVGNVLGAAGPVAVGWFIGISHGEYVGAFGFIGALTLLQGVAYWRIASWEKRTRALAPELDKTSLSGAVQ
ncbi:MAG TPA: MFS transporter [Bryobacteraceae bacterium]|nr:MFS transporter [Bryobacteraceae bacterium]